MFHKRLCFISKKLQLIQRITVNGDVPCTSKTSGTNSSLLLRKKNPQGKRREKRKQGARLVEGSEKSHNTNTKFHFREVTITSEDYKIFLYISENYNQQSRSPHLKKLQSAKPFLYQLIMTGQPQSRQKPQEREREKNGEGENRGGQ